MRTKILDFRGFDSSRILISGGGIPRPTGDVPEMSSRQISVRRIFVWRLTIQPRTYTTEMYYTIWLHNLDVHVLPWSKTHIFILGWDNNPFNNLHFKHHVKQRNTLEMGRGKSLIFSDFLKRRLSK